MYQRAIYSQYSDHKFGFLSDFPCVHELWFMFKILFPVRSNYLSSGKMGGLK